MKQKKNEELNTVRGIRHTLKGIFRASGSFFILSASSVLIAHYLFHLPVGQTAVGVGIPLVCLDVLRKILSALIPAPSSNKGRTIQIPAWIFFSGLLFLFSAFFGVASLMSSLLYRWVGFLSFARMSFDIATVLLYVGLSTFSGMVMVRSGLSKMIILVTLDTVRKVFVEIPIAIADHLFIGRPYFLHGAAGH